MKRGCWPTAGPSAAADLPDVPELLLGLAEAALKGREAASGALFAKFAPEERCILAAIRYAARQLAISASLWNSHSQSLGPCGWKAWILGIMWSLIVRFCYRSTAERTFKCLVATLGGVQPYFACQVASRHSSD